MHDNKNIAKFIIINYIGEDDYEKKIVKDLHILRQINNYGREYITRIKSNKISIPILLLNVNEKFNNLTF